MNCDVQHNVFVYLDWFAQNHNRKPLAFSWIETSEDSFEQMFVSFWDKACNSIYCNDTPAVETADPSQKWRGGG